MGSSPIKGFFFPRRKRKENFKKFRRPIGDNKMTRRPAPQPTVALVKRKNGDVEYEAAVFTFPDGREIEFHAHTHIVNYHSFTPEEGEGCIWISSNGPLLFRTHGSNGASVTTDYVFPQMP